MRPRGQGRHRRRVAGLRPLVIHMLARSARRKAHKPLQVLQSQCNNGTPRAQLRGLFRASWVPPGPLKLPMMGQNKETTQSEISPDRMAIASLAECHKHMAMGQKPNRTPSEHPNPHYRVKWAVHLPQNGTLGFDPQHLRKVSS